MKRWNINANEKSIKSGMFMMCKYYA